MTILLEQPWRLGLVLGLGTVILFLAGWLGQQEKWKRGAWILLASSVALMAVNILVVTEKESIHSMLRQMLADVEKGNLSNVLPYIADDYDHEEVNYSFLRMQLGGWWKRWRFSNIRVKDVKIRRGLGSFRDVTFGVKGNLLFGGFPRPIEKSVWTLRLTKAKGPRRWKITQIIPTEVTMPNRAGRAFGLKRMLQSRLSL